MLNFLVNLPIFKRLVPSIGIRLLKFLGKNKGFYRIKNILFYLDFLDPIDRKIILYKKYEHDSVSFLENLFKYKSISYFLDIGANAGYYSFYFADKFKSLKVKAYEPNLDAYYKFNKTLEKNSFENIEIFNNGLSDTEKKVKMITWYKHGHAKTNSIILEDNDDLKNSKIFEALFKVGDDLLNFKNEVLCIKIDVEGHEFKVLNGMINTLKFNKCILLIEIFQENFEKINTFLIKNNFSIIGKVEKRFNYFYSNF